MIILPLKYKFCIKPSHSFYSIFLYIIHKHIVLKCNKYTYLDWRLSDYHYWPSPLLACPGPLVCGRPDFPFNITAVSICPDTSLSVSLASIWIQIQHNNKQKSQLKLQVPQVRHHFSIRKEKGGGLVVISITTPL